MFNMLRHRATALFGSVLAKRLLLGLVITLTVCSLAFLALFTQIYRERLLQEHARASMQLNETLQASLENAMLKRDLPGLRAIVERAGQQDGVAEVMILNPQGDIRFASEQGRVGGKFQTPSQGQNLGQLRSATSIFTHNSAGEEVLRTMNPVHNQPECSQCHGSVTAHPINGIVVVDYHADRIRSDAMTIALAMALSGGLVTLAALVAVSLLVYRFILRPVQALSVATAHFAKGDLSYRLKVTDHDEIALLETRFNDMAAQLESTLGDLRTSEGFLQSVIDALPDGIRIINEDYSVIKINRAFCEQLGLTDKDVIGTPCHVLSHASPIPCSATLVTCPIVALREHPDEPLRCRHRHLRADGSELFVEISAAAMDVTIGGVRKTCVIESSRNLAEQARISQEQRLSELGHLATGIAHEVFNPLSSIQLALRAMREENAGSSLPESVESYLNIVNHEIERCVEMTGRLLRLSEPSTIGETLIDLRNVINDVVSLLRYQTDAAHVVVALNVDEGLRVIGAESDLGMIAVNLIQNAIHAMPEGGTLTISGQHEGDRLVLHFSDTGVGIADGDLPRLFWPFWSKRANASHGSGLGLSICKAAIERMGGSISASNNADKGACFTIILPSADAPHMRKTL